MGVTPHTFLFSLVYTMTRLTPAPGTQGSFLLETPFATEADVQYTVTALRSFAEIRARGTDPLALVYTPVGLTDTAMQADIAAGALIVVLSTSAGVLTYVPDTYILSYPSMGSIPYSHIIVSASVGMLPDSYDTTALTQSVTTAISDHIGVEPTVFVTKGEVTDVIDEQRHVQLTIARESAIKTRETDREQVLTLTAQLQTANAQITEYETVIQQLSEQLEAAEQAAAANTGSADTDTPAS